MSVLGFDSAVISRLCSALQDHDGLSPFARVEVMSDVVVELRSGYLMVIERQSDSIEHRTSVPLSQLPKHQREILEAAIGFWMVSKDVTPVPLGGGKYGIGEA
mgnify:CR=1 FL=1